MNTNVILLNTMCPYNDVPNTFIVKYRTDVNNVSILISRLTKSLTPLGYEYFGLTWNDCVIIKKV